MALGKLEFKLYIGEEALPVSDAEIVLINKDSFNILEVGTIRVDKNGNSKPIDLYTYERYLSESPDASIKPYKTYDALIASNNFKNKYIRDIPIFEGITSIQQVQMTPKVRGGVDLELIEIPPNGLIAEREEEDNLELNPVIKKSTKVMSEVVIPKYITVHLGTPSSNAQNVTVLFTDYIKNVASSEIYPTWPREALKSNIYAQISFTLNRIYTEWYRSRGYNFDITNSTAYDHYFVNGRNIFNTISEVVDEIFNEYISRNNFKEPLFAQYCNGTTSTCSGLSQWGTVNYAEAGDSAFKILTRYYGNNIELRISEIIQGIAESYPGTALKVGSKGENVTTIQTQLNRIRQNYPAIPKIDNENGVFNEVTKSAVKEFQKIFKLTVDGVVGKSTWYKISEIYVAVKKLAELHSEGEKLPITTKPQTEVIRKGSEGDAVKIAQYLVACVSAFYDNVPSVNITGYFDQNMDNSVRAFQKAFGLSVDGIIGKKTWNKLYEVYKGIEPYILTSSGDFMKYPGRLIKKGSKGEDVRLIQTWINEISNTYNFIPKLDVDGIFGSRTKDAVIIFQRWAGLVADGIVGPLTWDKLYEVYRRLVKK